MSSAASTDQRYIEYCQEVVEHVRGQEDRSRRTRRLMGRLTPLCVVALVAIIVSIVAAPNPHGGTLVTFEAMSLAALIVGIICCLMYWVGRTGDTGPLTCEGIISLHCQSYADWRVDTERSDQRSAEVIAVAAVAC
jgi:hypothetical protein